jgi:hypothetical protein
MITYRSEVVTMTILRQLTWTLLATGALSLAACSEEPDAPTGPPDIPTANVLTGSVDALSPGGTSNTVMAKAVSTRGWVLGNFYLSGFTVRAKAWSPYPDYAVSTVTDTGSVYSAADEHGDVTAHMRSGGPVVYLADAVSGGIPYAVAQLPLPPNPGDPGNWIAKGLNNAHMAVGSGSGRPMAWMPTAPGAASWLEPVMLPLPDFPRGINSAEAVGVNSSGLVVGTVQELLKRGITSHAWHWRVEQVSGVWTATSLGELPWASGSEDQAGSDVNDAGVIVGSVNQHGNSYAALWFPDAAGNYTQPPTVGPGPAWNTTHVNRCGWTVSSMMAKGGTGDVVAWNGSQAISLPMMVGSFASRAWDINDNGVVAGTSVFRGKGKNAPTTQVATVWRDFVPACPS